MDLHGSQGCSSDLNSMCSCFGGEVYGNEIITNSWNTKWFTPRGGKSLAFYNDYQGNGSPSFNVSVSAVSCPSSGYIEENMIHDTYFWGNRKNTTGAITPAGCDECPPYLSDCGRSGNRPLAGTDYFYDSSNPGVGCGTLANLPSSCTVGQGYWATNQSCSSLAGLAGKNPSTPISGTLYKCAATNTWTPYYQPYLYPHPLRMEQPTSPLNLRIVP
jgi:hypothetical protein